ncbi:uncharacterized protein PV06_03364 [Exophiala oligosperma]|uniref:Ribosomal protein S14 n=1 Tax=Exophiala oligosperma TaxID=215243 RepID=A0A0D2EAC6_9EURO|nr:uncharacterized protein PV06_03364 [Exophiala oligosperma]KIW44929.1 hypothetical protein PV06_03364 [Exophiala oligosperma]
MAAQWRAKKLDLGGFINIKIIRDHSKRKAYERFEPQRQALRYVIRNTSLPQWMRTQAQLELQKMHCYTRPTQIKNRCVMGGVSRSVLRDFKMGRVSTCCCCQSRPAPRSRPASWVAVIAYSCNTFKSG